MHTLAAAAHARVRLLYEFRLYVFVRYARWRACQEWLLTRCIVSDMACAAEVASANDKEHERWKDKFQRLQKKLPYSFAATSKMLKRKLVFI